MASNPSTRPTRSGAPRRAPGRTPLRVVRPDARVRTVGVIGSAVAGFFFAVLFALAGLHAVVVQTQVELDAVNAEIATLEELHVQTLADLAWTGSAVGLAETALDAGYVPAAEPVALSPVPPGRLAPPPTDDPFGVDAMIAGGAG